ncbi:MAG: cobalamin-dependent protein [Magnetococcales bacterium]|nr:cobalamin-dependent protein [Magnetococcales bacterium]
MRCCLINPPWLVRKGNIWSQIRATMPSLGLLYLAATLEREGFAVAVLDFQAEILGWEGMEARIAREPCEIYGITVSTTLAKSAYRLAGIIRKHHPQALVVLGGYTSPPCRRRPCARKGSIAWCAARGRRVSCDWCAGSRVRRYPASRFSTTVSCVTRVPMVSWRIWTHCPCPPSIWWT